MEFKKSAFERLLGTRHELHFVKSHVDWRNSEESEKNSHHSCLLEFLEIVPFFKLYLKTLKRPKLGYSQIPGNSHFLLVVKFCLVSLGQIHGDTKFSLFRTCEASPRNNSKCLAFLIKSATN